MIVTNLEYNMSKFDVENVEKVIADLGLNVNNYFFALTKPSMLSRTLVGNIADFSSRYAIVCFSETEINLIMLSRMSNKKVTELIRINREEIKSVKFSNILISYMLKMKLNDSTMNFQVFKKFGKFAKVKNSLELFKKTY